MEILMAIFDLVPVVICFIAMLKLQICLYEKMSKYSFALLASGTIMVLIAGFLKALWKILYFGFNLDFYRLNYLFFPVQAIGFILAFLGILFMLVIKKNKVFSLAILSVVIPDENKIIPNDTMLYVVFQIIGSAGIYGLIMYMASKMKKKSVIIFMIISLIAMLMMGFLSTRISRTTGKENIMYNWLAEMVNTIGQISFLLGVLRLEKAGLKEYKFN